MHNYYIGIDLGGTNIKAALLQDDFTRVAKKSMATEAELGSDHVVNRLIEVVTAILEESQLHTDDIRCLGIGIPGSLDLKNGIAKSSPNFSFWKDVPVVQKMQDRLQIPTFIDNDARMNLYGEWTFGAGKGKNNLALLTLGTGIGAGIIVGGRVLYGASDCAGEVGHMKLYPNGRKCNCGGNGCFEAYASATGLVRTMQEKLKNGQNSVLNQWTNHNDALITAEMISQAFDLGDPAAVEAMEFTGEVLGYGLSNVINLFNPETVIIGGGMAAAGERLLKPAREIVAGQTLPDSKNVCSITAATLGNEAGILGAAVYAKMSINKSGPDSKNERD